LVLTFKNDHTPIWLYTKPQYYLRKKKIFNVHECLEVDLVGD
jgi:hypothetical protein